MSALLHTLAQKTERVLKESGKRRRKIIPALHCKKVRESVDSSKKSQEEKPLNFSPSDGSSPLFASTSRVRVESLGIHIQKFSFESDFTTINAKFSESWLFCSILVSNPLDARVCRVQQNSLSSKSLNSTHPYFHPRNSQRIVLL